MKTETQTITKADRSAVLDFGCEDKRINNVSPTYRGTVEINGHRLTVDRASSFNGVLHYAIWGYIDGEAVCGWIPACLCNIP